MGTTWLVQLANTTISNADQALIQGSITKVLELVCQSMSPYRETSEISLFNKAKAGEVFKLSKEMYTVCLHALHICNQTQGAYDITVAPLVNRWGFGADKVQQLPSEAEVKELIKQVDYQALQLSPAGLVKSKDEVAIDLCSIAKGYGIDKVCDLLDTFGYHDYYVEVGGDARVAGYNDAGKPWRIGIAYPEVNSNRDLQVLELGGENIAIAMSANYQNLRADAEGKVYSGHEINPKTGFPYHSSLQSVTVLADFAMVADGYATALFALGEQALDFANQANIPALLTFRTAEGELEVKMSNTYQALLGQAPANS